MLSATQYKGMQVDYYLVDETRPTLVFLHDSLGCIELWRDFPQLLADAVGCNVLVYDRLGYGESIAMPTFERPVDYLEKEADLLNDILEHYTIKQAILFGHSDGGSIALITAAKYPQRITALICEAGHIFVEDITLNGIREAINQYTTTDLKTRLAKYHSNKVEAIFKAWTLTWTREDFRDWNIEHLLPLITCPLLFIQGRNDEFGSLKQLHTTVAAVSGNAEAFIVPNAGHTPHKEAKEAVIKEATSFINEIKLILITDLK